MFNDTEIGSSQITNNKWNINTDVKILFKTSHAGLIWNRLFTFCDHISVYVSNLQSPYCNAYISKTLIFDIARYFRKYLLRLVRILTL